MEELHLSYWNDKIVEKVVVPANIKKKLRRYHIFILRFLYSCIHHKFPGVILNYDEWINIPLAFQALWQALIDADKLKLPLLIISSDDNVVMWHYHLSQLGKVSILNSQNCKTVFGSSLFSIILVPKMNIKLLQSYEENEFSFVVVEDFDGVATRRLFKTLRGEFNVALTKKDFMVDRDCKIIWHMLHWTNPGKFGKLKDFAGYDNDNLEDLINPYDDIWYIHRHNVEDKHMEEVKTEKEDIEKVLSDWASKNKLPEMGSRTLRKRKSASPKGGKAKKRTPNKGNTDAVENCDKGYHEQATQLVDEMGCQNLADDCSKVGSTQPGKQTKSLRDVTDLKYDKLMAVEEVKVNQKRTANEEPAFQSTFLKNKSVKRRPIGFHSSFNQKPNTPSSYNTKITAGTSVLSKPMEQDQVFPSLEDILTLKKKTANATPSQRIPEKVISNRKEGGLHSAEHFVTPSLEEVFGCKRKLIDTSSPLKKLNINDSPPNLVQSPSNNPTLPIGSISNMIADSEYSSTLLNKETQTEHDLQGVNKRSDSFLVDDLENITPDDCNKGDNNNPTARFDRSDVIENVSDLRASEKTSTTNRGMKDFQNPSVADVDAKDLGSDESDNVLLSIVEGKFSSQTIVNKNNNIQQKLTASDKEERTDFVKHNSQVLLGPLFGDEIIDGSGKTKESVDLDATTETFSTLHLSNLLTSDIPYSSQLRVRTISQINRDSCSQTTQDVCESLDILYGDKGECSKSMNGKNSNCMKRHSLISSLFG